MSDASRARPWRAARAAAVFLTRVPLGGFPFSDAEWRWAPAYFPLVGLLLGLCASALWIGLGWTVGDHPWVQASLVVGAGMLVTGGFHEDGLADTADAMGGGYTRERVLEILKDSRVGAYGAMALFVVLFARIACLAALGPAAPLALVVSQCISRCPPIWLMVALTYATDDARAKSRRVTAARRPQALVASVWPGLLLVGLWLTGRVPAAGGVALVVASGLVTLAGARRFRRSVGGITGDFLGANQQLVEVTTLLVMLRWMATSS